MNAGVGFAGDGGWWVTTLSEGGLDGAATAAP
jgi:hypothetical protein